MRCSRRYRPWNAGSTSPTTFDGWPATTAEERPPYRHHVGVAAQVLKALVGDVVITTQQVEGQEKPQMVARFTINAVPAFAVLERGKPTDRDSAPVPVWDSIQASPNPGAATTAGPAEVIVPLIYDRKAAARRAAEKRDGAA